MAVDFYVSLQLILLITNSYGFIFSVKAVKLQASNFEIKKSDGKSLFDSDLLAEQKKLWNRKITQGELDEKIKSESRKKEVNFSQNSGSLSVVDLTPTVENRKELRSSFDGELQAQPSPKSDSLDDKSSSWTLLLDPQKENFQDIYEMKDIDQERNLERRNSKNELLWNQADHLNYPSTSFKKFNTNSGSSSKLFRISLPIEWPLETQAIPEGLDEMQFLPQAANQFQALPQEFGQYLALPQELGQYQSFPQELDQYQSFPQESGLYQSFPQEFGQYSSFPQEYGQYQPLPRELGQYQSFPQQLGQEMVQFQVSPQEIGQFQEDQREMNPFQEQEQGQIRVFPQALDQLVSNQLVSHDMKQFKNFPLGLKQFQQSPKKSRYALLSIKRGSKVPPQKVNQSQAAIQNHVVAQVTQDQGGSSQKVSQTQTRRGIISEVNPGGAAQDKSSVHISPKDLKHVSRQVKGSLKLKNSFPTEMNQIQALYPTFPEESLLAYELPKTVLAQISNGLDTPAKGLISISSVPQNILQDQPLSSVSSMFPFKSFPQNFVRSHMPSQELLKKNLLLAENMRPELIRTPSESIQAQSPSLELLQAESLPPEILRVQATSPELLETESISPKLFQTEALPPEMFEVQSLRPELVQAQSFPPELVQAQSFPTELVQAQSLPQEFYQVQPKANFQSSDQSQSMFEIIKSLASPANKLVRKENDPNLRKKLDMLQTSFPSENRHNNLIRQASPHKSLPLPSGVEQFNHAAVASDDERCSKLGKQILLQRSGSAVDAAIGVLLCLGVVNPQSSGIGGGHLMTIYQSQSKSKKKKKEMVSIIGREKAPAAALSSMFHDIAASQTGGLSIAVPTEVMGFYKAHCKYGRLPWNSLFNDAIVMADKGFAIYPALADAIARNELAVANSPGLRAMFVNPNGSLKRQGDVCRNRKLARTLEKIRDDPKSFYAAPLMRDIVADIRDSGGILHEDDVENVDVLIKPTTKSKLKTGPFVLHTPPPPSSGVILQFMMKILDGYGLCNNSLTGSMRLANIHRIAEALKFGMARVGELGDEDFLDLGKILKNLTSSSFAEEIRKKINDSFTLPEQSYFPIAANKDNRGTTHVSIIDADGSAVSATSTINTYFGSKVVGNRTGIIFNSEMADFSSQANRGYGGHPLAPSNYVAPGKIPMSSMCPTIVLDKNKQVAMVIGSAGGRKITTTIAQVMIRALWIREGLLSAIDAPRMYPLLPGNILFYEKGLDREDIYNLIRHGHLIRQQAEGDRAVCNAVVTAASGDKTCLVAVSDGRKGGRPAGY